jgi:hypothetical protein
VPLPGSGARQRARIQGERRLIALLCVDPAAANVAVSVAGAGTLPLSEAVAPSEFVDPRHSAIFAAIQQACDDGRALSFDGLLGEVADPDVKRLASDLYIFGTEVLRAAAVQSGLGSVERSVADEIVISWNDLESLARRERFRAGGGHDSVDSTAAGQAAVEEMESQFRDRGSEHEPGRLSGTDPNPRASRTQRNQSHESHTPHLSPGVPVEGADGMGPSVGPNAESDPASDAGELDPRNRELRGAVERLARLRERGHDATAVSALFRRRASGPETDPGRSSNQ